VLKLVSHFRRIAANFLRGVGEVSA
jgi:hypothetical protein